MRSPESQPLRDIGQKLVDAGGMDLMLEAHKKATMRGVNGRILKLAGTALVAGQDKFYVNVLKIN